MDNVGLRQTMVIGQRHSGKGGRFLPVQSGAGKKISFPNLSGSSLLIQSCRHPFVRSNVLLSYAVFALVRCLRQEQ